MFQLTWYGGAPATDRARLQHVNKPDSSTNRLHLNIYMRSPYTDKQNTPSDGEIHTRLAAQWCSTYHSGPADVSSSVCLDGCGDSVTLMWELKSRRSQSRRATWQAGLAHNEFSGDPMVKLLLNTFIMV